MHTMNDIKWGTVISSVATPIAGAMGLDCYDPATRDLRPESNCAKMRDDFDIARYPSDYVNSVLDRIRKRGKYTKQPTKER